MGGRKVTLTFSEEDLALLEKEAKAQGFDRLTSAIKVWIRRKIPLYNLARYEIEIDNKQEIEGYVREKKLTSIPVFARFTMAQYMNKYPLTEAQKTRVEKSIE